MRFLSMIYLNNSKIIRIELSLQKQVVKHATNQTSGLTILYWRTTEIYYVPKHPINQNIFLK